MKQLLFGIKRGIYPAIRKGKDKSLEFVMWAPDQPVKPWTKHGGPGLAHMVNLKFDINEVFEKKTELAFKNNSRKMPFSVRRYELNDLNNDGLPDLFLLGSREDGRDEWNKPRIDKVASNMIDIISNTILEKTKLQLLDSVHSRMIMVSMILIMMALKIS